MLIVKTGNIINNSTHCWLYVTLEVDGDTCEFIHTVPSGLSDEKLQAYVDSKQESYKFDILRDMYPDHPNIQDLEAMEQWIADGCVIPATETEPERVAEKVLWTNKHPAEQDIFDRCKPSIESKAKLQAFVDKIPEAQILMDMLIGR